MAIDRVQFKMVLEADVKGAVLSAGYPDLLIAPDRVPVADKFKRERPNSADLQAHHGVRHPILDSVLAFEGLGMQLEVIDREVIEGCERVVDLNLPTAFIDRYDLVIDPGTIEHCFNLPQAALNLANAVGLGGYLCQAVPMAMFNHGYYNLNPIWFLDFYSAAGFEMRQFVIRSSQGAFKNPGRERLLGVPDGAVLCTLAQRTSLTTAPFAWPQQPT